MRRSLILISRDAALRRELALGIAIVRSIAFIAFGASLSGCTDSDKPTSIVVSGDTAGWITPCGCAANQSGGLLRRATLLENLGGARHVLYLDAGGSAPGTTEYQRLKLEAILRGLKSMNLVAHNIGGPEAALSPTQLAQLAKRTGVQWVSANLQPTASDSPAQKSITAKRDGLQFVVTGVIDPALVKNEAWSARDPVSAALEATRDVEADVRILLAYFDEPGLRALAQSLPEFDFVIGGPTGQAMKPATIGPVQVLSATNKGKFLAKIEFARDGAKPNEIKAIGPAEVTSNLAENPSQARNLARYYSDLAKRDFTVGEAGLADNLQLGSGNDQIAGSDSCVKCHATEDATWHASRHSHAFEVLVAKQAHYDPYCQQCHTTGYGYDGGFVSVARTASSINVGCENCHGPSAAHVANPKTRTPFLAREQCIRCHDHENSPQFNYDTYWPKIRHGKNEHVAPTGGAL
jgi:hypothetical protein